MGGAGHGALVLVTRGLLCPVHLPLCPAPFLPRPQLPQWVPLSVVKGGTAANMLVKGLGSDLMRERTEKTLVQVCVCVRVRVRVQLLGVCGCVCG